MNKLFVLLGVLGMLGVFLMIGVSSVIAVDQGINASVSENIILHILPKNVSFGTVLPGTFNNNATTGNITFNATGSNSNITVDVSTVTGIPFEDGLKLDGMVPTSSDFMMGCTIVGGVCTYSIKTLIPTLDVPIGTPAGIRTGTITYLIIGIPPI